MRVAQAFLLCSLLWVNSIAQTTNATLGGTVSDSSGALIPGVSITATNTQTGIVNTAVTNESGAYQFASLQNGRYNVRAELPGFQSQARNDFDLGVSQQVRLNFVLQVGNVAQSVDVNVAADTLIATTSSSVGAVLPEYKVRDLPLVTRNVIDLVGTTAGASSASFAGGRMSAINVTRDGVTTTDGRYAAQMGVSTTTYVSPDLVEEVRVIVAPADAELGRGSGQVQMATRAGTNQLKGSIFWTNRNSALDTNSWLNNFNGARKDYRNGNQFGGRVGGPVVKNKTFFFFLFEGQRYVTKKQFTGPVLTAEARQGLFRFYPGVQNGNAISNSPTVDRLGTPVKPAGATGDLMTVNLFGKDPNRLTMDNSGWVTRLLSRMPLPNDFTSCGPMTTGSNCDGLNVAGHRWLRRVQGEDTTNGDGQDTNRNQYNVRIDHNFNSNHKITFSGTYERNWSMSEQSGITNWPEGYSGTVLRKPKFYSGSFVSTVSPTVVNEFRFGYRQGWHYGFGSALRYDSVGDEVRGLLASKNGKAFFPGHILFPENFIANLAGNGSRGQTSPIFVYNDTLSWTKGKHAFKTGAEFRFSSSRGFNGSENPDWQFPGVSIGAGSTPVVGISTIPGLVGANVTLAQNVLLDLSGSVSGVSQTYNVRQPSDQFQPITRVRDYRQNEFGAFFKDDWKIRPNLTLNLGVRFDYYGVPYEALGAMTNPIGGTAGLFGLSGTSFADMWQPGKQAGSLTRVEWVGKHSPNPGRQLYNDDWNNFAPAVGFSWSLPWLGKEKTVLRAGYGTSYQGTTAFNNGLNLYLGGVPGGSTTQNLTTLGLGANYYNLSTVPLPIPNPTEQPLFTWGLDRRSGTMAGFEDNRVTPYIQNWNIELQRELANNLTFEARYIGSKGTKLYGRINLNTVNIYENGILDAFNITREGGNAKLFDDMLRGLNLGMGPINGTSVTASASLRANTLTRTFLANGSVGEFAQFLNSSTTVTGKAGGLLLANGLPENFIKVNPQFDNVYIDGNPSNSTYHSMQLQVTKRLSQGFTNQTSYTWSRTLSDSSNDGGNTAAGAATNHFYDPRNRSINKSLTTFHRTHTILSNGTFELPFGRNRRFLKNNSGWVGRLVEQWQLGAVFSWSSGAPLDLAAPISTVTQVNSNLPVILGDFPKSSGKVTPVAVGATYFPDLKQIADPTKASVTTLQGLDGQFSNRAITDANGKILLANPSPGKIGTLGGRWIEGPGHVGLDMNLMKRIRIGETRQFEVRVDARNFLNTPYWANPDTNINSPNFGRMLASGSTGSNNADINSGARSFTISTRLNF
jgi:hypothetical protein